MKILLVNKYWYARGGAENVALRTKAILEQAGHTVEIFGVNHPKNIFSNKYFVDYTEGGGDGWLEKIKFGLRAIYNSQARANMEKLLDDFKPDVVHLHNIYHQLSFSILKPIKKRGIRTVMTLHDYHLISPNYNLFCDGKIDESSLGKNFYKCFFSNCLGDSGKSFVASLEAYFIAFNNYANLIDKFISPSEFLKNKFLSTGFDDKKIDVVYNPVDLVEEVNANVGDYVLYFGRLAHEKGLDVFLSAAKNLPNIRFKIIGDGELKNSIEEQIKKENIHNCETVGFLQGDELKKIVSNARIVVLPSIWLENAPLTVAETGMLGKIVLASDIGGIPELVPKEFLFKVGDYKDLLKKIKFWSEQMDEKIITAGKELRARVLHRHDPKIYLKSLLGIYKND